MMKALILMATSLLGASAMAIPTGPVMVGGAADFDACGGWGLTTVTTTLFVTDEVTGQVKFETIDASTGVYFCDDQTDGDGEYTGIVFSTDPNVSCGVSSPIAKRQAYKGACKSGWVKSEYLLLTAG